MKKYLYVLFGLVMVSILLAACGETGPGEAYHVVENAPDSISGNPEAGKIQDIVLLEQQLYIAAENGLYLRDILTGADDRLSETRFSFLECDEEALYGYVDETKSVVCMTADGVTTTTEMPEELSGIIRDFLVTETYFVFLSRVEDGNVFTLYHRDTTQTEVVPTHANVTAMAAYRKNEILLYYSASSSADCYLTSYHLDTDTFGEKYPVSTLSVQDICYDPYHKSVFLYGLDNVSGLLSLDELFLQDGIIQTRITFEKEGLSLMNCRTALSGNLVGCVQSDRKTVRFYDMEKDYPAVNVALIGFPQADLQYMATEFQSRYHVMVNLMQYEGNEGKKKLAMKLQAGDSDIDLYVTTFLDPAYYVRAGAYTDLNTVDSLREKIASSPFVSATAEWSGTIVGVPINPYFYDSAIDRRPDGTRDNMSAYAYMARYTDLVEKQYTDADGTALSELYRHLAEYPEDDADSPLWGEFRLILGDLVMLNPNAAHPTEAAQFLTELLCLYMGEREEERKDKPVAALISLYPEGEDFSGAYRKWTFWNQSIYAMILDGSDAVLGGQDAAQTAADVAASVRMAVQE